MVRTEFRRCRVGEGHENRSEFRRVHESSSEVVEELCEMEAREVVGKFADLNLVKRERVDRCIVKEEQFCVRIHDLLPELCKKMEVDEQQAWHIGLINAYTTVLEEGKVSETRSGAWWKMEYGRRWTYI